jgi:phosphoribosylglycinamide formyltransferase-1
MSERPGIVILGSGGGTTAEALIYATQLGTVEADVKLVISNSMTKGLFRKVERINSMGHAAIDTLYVTSKTNPDGPNGDGAQTDEEAEFIYENTTDAVGEDGLVLLMGYMKKVRGPLLNMKHILNFHPGPLPFTAGLAGIDVQKHLLANEYPVSGHTIHHVTEEYDAGAKVSEHLAELFYDYNENTRLMVSRYTAEQVADDVQGSEKAHVASDIQGYITNHIL